MPDPLVVSQVLFYTADGKEYREGANANERVHQQTEGHRTEISRLLQPGTAYFLKVEANSPGYEVELRLRKPAPYTDPREAVRLAMYDHLSQVDAWLLNRPRGASVDRRIRDTGSLLGSHCMSCHTQSGVWGPVGAIANGYRVENVANLRHLINVMYESLRPTNVLQDAANNTSLAPLDLGDGPAGTRVAGYNVTTLEALVPARRLHSAQQIRTANFVLQSADPSGINAAGPGSNVGQSIVYRFAGEILRRAWEQTRDERYLAALEQKAEKMLTVVPKYSDDLSNRIEFFVKTMPANYVAIREESDAAKALWARSRKQIAEDEQRLRALQKPDGTWGFHPGVNGTTDPKDIDPAPTALALTALAALGHDDRDSAVKRGVDALLKMQDPYGRWNRNALTGFVTTAYVLHALSRLYPDNAPGPQKSDFTPAGDESLSDTVARFRAMAQLGLNVDDGQYVDLILPGADHASPQVRYWAQIALGAVHNERGVAAQLRGLGDPVKMVREAARWGMRQTLLDDKGWDHLFAAYETADDLTRESMAGALLMRADGVLSRTAAGYPRLAGALGSDDEQRSASGRARLGVARGVELVGVEPARSSSFERSVPLKPGTAGTKFVGGNGQTLSDRGAIHRQRSARKRQQRASVSRTGDVVRSHHEEIGSRGLRKSLATSSESCGNVLQHGWRRRWTRADGVCHAEVCRDGRKSAFAILDQSGRIEG